MKYIKYSGISILISIMSLLVACDDNTTTIGSVISTGEVVINVDSITYKLNAKAVKTDVFDSKSGNLMIGSIQVDNYGTLDCSFVTRLMPSANLEIPDSIFELENFIERVDSCKILMGAKRSEITGDSLAPQKMTVFKLTEQLPAEINNTFNPEGYYNPSDPFGSLSYTVSGVAQKDSAFYKNKYVELNMNLPLEFGKEIFRKYKEEPEIFQWPQIMAKEFLPGLYFKPTFGNGCVANINNLYLGVFYYTLNSSTEVDEDGKTTTTVSKVTNLAVPFTVSPEVLSSNNIKYIPSENIIEKNSIENNDGEVIITTPGGYIAQFVFPAEELIERYKSENTNLSTVNDLNLYIPAEPYDPDSGIGLVKNILLIKTSDYEEFFANNKVPDNLSSFIGAYNSSDGLYYFNTMRSYFLDLLKKEEITEEDVTFSLIPVEITTETSSSYIETTYVTKCVPFTNKPTMTLMKTNESIISFSFSTQIID